MALFGVHCITCSARLKVTDASAIGHILACPKCGELGRALIFANQERAGVVFHCPQCGEQELHELNEE